jgi:hypothetical protein
MTLIRVSEIWDVIGVSFGGICCASTGVRFACSFVVGAPAPTSSMSSRMAAPDCCSLFRCRSGSGHAWTCSSVLAGGFHSGFFTFFFCDQNGSPPPSHPGRSFVAFVAVVTGSLSSLKTATPDRCYHYQRRSVAADVHSTC